MRLLFVTSTRVGDAILSSGILDHLIGANPGCRVTVACGPAAAALFSALPGLERIVVLEKMAFSLHWLALWAACVGTVWDVIVDLRNAPLTLLLAARRRYRIRRSREAVHRVVKMAEVVGLADNPPTPRLWTGDAHRAAAVQRIPDGSPVLAIGPTANWVAKTWPADRFAELAERLTGPAGILPGGRVALFGCADERPSAVRLIEAIPAERRLDLIGRLDLIEVFACLERCAFYVGNDSGLMHLAAAAGVPTLGLFGPSPEAMYAPWGPFTDVVRPDAAYEEIFPDGFDPKDTGTLMNGLSVHRVEQAAVALWRRVRETAA